MRLHVLLRQTDEITGTNEKTGLEYINEAIEKLSLKHDEHMKLYGTGNELRMTGKYETSRFDHIYLWYSKSWGIS